MHELDSRAFEWFFSRMSKTKPKLKLGNVKATPISELIPHPDNPNEHPTRQVELLAKIISAQGWRAPIVVSNLSGFIVAGHARLLAAQHLDLDEVPVDRQDFASRDEELAHLVADNRIAEIADMNFEGIANILHELGEDTDLDLTGFLDFEREPLLAGDWSPANLDDLPTPDGDKVAPVMMTDEQRKIFNVAVSTIREQEDDPSMSEGRIVELLSADFISGK